AMVSAEPFTFPPGGRRFFKKKNKSYKGQPLIDRQHPHDLFMELSATYTVPIGERASWFVYGGYPGEPALGPNAFMHRASASENTSAPLSHHLRTRRTSVSEWLQPESSIAGSSWRAHSLTGASRAKTVTTSKPIRGIRVQ